MAGHHFKAHPFLNASVERRFGYERWEDRPLKSARMLLISGSSTAVKWYCWVWSSIAIGCLLFAVVRFNVEHLKFQMTVMLLQSGLRILFQLAYFFWQRGVLSTLALQNHDPIALNESSLRALSISLPANAVTSNHSKAFVNVFIPDDICTECSTSYFTEQGTNVLK